MYMRLAKTIDEIAQRQKALDSFRLRKLPQAPNDRRVNGKNLIQACPEVASR